MYNGYHNNHVQVHDGELHDTGKSKITKMYRGLQSMIYMASSLALYQLRMCVCGLTSITDATFIQFTYVTGTLFYIPLMISINNFLLLNVLLFSINYTHQNAPNQYLMHVCTCLIPRLPHFWNTNIELVQGSLHENEASAHHSSLLQNDGKKTALEIWISVYGKG